MNNYWIVPCNIEFFDVVEHFKKAKKVIWKNISRVQPGDFVYIYLGVPYKELRYKCVVLNENVSNEVLQHNQYAMPRRPMSPLYQGEIKYMELELLVEYPADLLPLCNLKMNGLGQVQVQSRVNDRLQLYIDTVCEMEQLL